MHVFHTLAPHRGLRHTSPPSAVWRSVLKGQPYGSETWVERRVELRDDRCEQEDGPGRNSSIVGSDTVVRGRDAFLSALFEHGNEVIPIGHAWAFNPHKREIRHGSRRRHYAKIKQDAGAISRGKSVDNTEPLVEFDDGKMQEIYAETDLPNLKDGLINEYSQRETGQCQCEKCKHTSHHHVRGQDMQDVQCGKK